jgi:hypothetical protein
MEILLAFLLFLGGFTLGSVSDNNAAEAKASSTTTHATSEVETRGCHFVRGPVYRDLSVSYLGKDDLLSIQDGDCGKECPDD